MLAQGNEIYRFYNTLILSLKENIRKYQTQVLCNMLVNTFEKKEKEKTLSSY